MIQDVESVSAEPGKQNVESVSPLVKHEMRLSESKLELIYKIDDVPPWYMCILLGLQHYLTAFGSNLMLPIVVANLAFCMNGDSVGIGELISTTFFVSGLSTLLQTTFGCRLPIMQGASFGFLTPVITLFSLQKWQCPYAIDLPGNNTLPDVGSDGHREIWQLRLREFQGCLMIASLIQIFIGFSGLMEVFLSFVGPLTIMPTITLIGLGLFEVASNYSSGQWYIAFLTTALICIFSQYMKNIDVPCFIYKKGRGCTKTSLSLFKMFPVLFAIFIVWILCFILTVTDVFPKEKGKWGHEARTDLYTDVLYKSAWFRFPYPGQWGVPSVSTAGVLGILASVFASIIESVGDYYACARMAGEAPPPIHAINRGIGMEGITCFLAGAWGAASGNTSYSENIGAIGITKIASLRVMQIGAFVMILLGCLGKFGALFVTIPIPVIGGMFFVVFGMVGAVGISNLRHVSLDSSRNLFVIGTSLLVGLSLPMWVQKHPGMINTVNAGRAPHKMGTINCYAISNLRSISLDSSRNHFIIGTSLLLGLSLPMWVQKNPGMINTGSSEFDQIITVLLGTNMFVGGVLGLFLDNTLPGTDEERGMSYWKKMREETSSGESHELKIYNLPALFQRQIDKVHCFTFLPFCPGYNSYVSRAIKRICKCCKTKKDAKFTVNENDGKEDLEDNVKNVQLKEVI